LLMWYFTDLMTARLATLKGLACGTIPAVVHAYI